MTPLRSLAWPLALHLSVAALMAVGLMFDDGPGRLAWCAAAWALGLMGVDAATGAPRLWPTSSFPSCTAITPTIRM